MNGFDVRFYYDSTKLKLSNINTNEIADLDIDNGFIDTPSYFKFEDEFASSLEMLVFSDTINGVENYNIMQAVVSFVPPVNASEHIENVGQSGRIVNTERRAIIRKNEFPNDRRKI